MFPSVSFSDLPLRLGRLFSLFIFQLSFYLYIPISSTPAPLPVFYSTFHVSSLCKWSRGSLLYFSMYNPTLTVVSLSTPGCKPVQLWHLIRHGSRSMHRMDFMKMETQLPMLQKMILAAHSVGNGMVSWQSYENFR